MGNKELVKALAELTEKCNKLESANKRLTEIAYRHEAQIARDKVEGGDLDSIRSRFFNQYFCDFRETAISIFSHENLPNDPLGFFNSKRIEAQIFNHGKVVLYKKKYTYGDDKKKFETYFIEPFTGVGGSDLDPYLEFPVIQTVPQNGGTAETLTVGEDCVIFTDFFEWTQTNANTSLTVGEATKHYAEIIADIEITKRINRNWLKIPFLFGIPGDMGTGELPKMVKEINDLLCGVEKGSKAFVSKYVKNLELLPTGAQYAGMELEQCRKDYINEYLNFLGIGHILNENKARKINAEFEKTSDQYNINIIKRLQLRLKGWEQAKKIWKDDFKDVIVRVNLDGFATPYDQAAEKAEEGGENANNTK